MSSDIKPFNRQLVRQRRERAAAGFAATDFLHHAVADQLADRLLDVARTFTTAADIGCRDGAMASRLLARPDIATCIQLDLAPGFARQALRPRGPSLVGDEEALPLAPGVFDLITSALALHWVNDLPGALIQIRCALKPDGFFLAAMAGGESLFELRTALQEAEARCHGGLSPRVSPMTDVRDLGGLLQRAGLALPVVDSDTIEVTYDTPFKLMRDLRLMGETNAVAARRRAPPGKAFWATVDQIYRDRYALPGGRVLASFDILYMAGWAPAATQQQPLAPGSARHRLADALHTQEQVLPDIVAAPKQRYKKKGGGRGDLKSLRPYADRRHRQ